MRPKQVTFDKAVGNIKLYQGKDFFEMPSQVEELVLHLNTMDYYLRGVCSELWLSYNCVQIHSEIFLEEVKVLAHLLVLHAQKSY